MEYMYYVPPKATVVERILDASLKLFNDEGFHSVTAIRIAKHLGISGGHLAYHFKGKAEILEALFPRLEKRLQDLLEMEFEHTIPRSIDRTLHELQVIWEYRFFFTELPQLAALDPKIFRFYLMFEQHIVEMTRKAFDSRVAEGTMKPIQKPNSTKLLARNLWILWLDWVRHESLEHPGQAVPSSDSVHDVILRAYCIAQPFFPESFLDEVARELDRRLKPKKPARSATAVLARAAKRKRA